jgi:hypothetical protein
MGNLEKNALLGHNVNAIKQSEIFVILLVIKNLPLFGKEGLEEIFWMRISKSPLSPFSKGGSKKGMTYLPINLSHTQAKFDALLSQSEMVG